MNASPPDLWPRVSPSAKWKDCPAHGKVLQPTLREKACANGARHIMAVCTLCGHFLGYLARKKTHIDASTDEKRTAYRRYCEDAKAKGYAPGHAAHRFRADFGHFPNPAWRDRA